MFRFLPSPISPVHIAASGRQESVSFVCFTDFVTVMNSLHLGPGKAPAHMLGISCPDQPGKCLTTDRARDPSKSAFANFSHMVLGH